jgi:glycerol-3-phosphate O-acyltransferase / dihydroxyacetone phosphate acyltransferase
MASILSNKKAKGTQVSQIYLAFFYTIAEALAASVVKIHGRDVIATWKVLISLGVASVLYSFYALAATILVFKAKAPWKWRLLTPPLTIAALPTIGYAALRFGEAGMDVLK